MCWLILVEPYGLVVMSEILQDLGSLRVGSGVPLSLYLSLLLLTVLFIELILTYN